MDRFLGRHAKRIDAKGRVSIPAPFRAVLARDGFEGLFVVRSPASEAVEAGGNQLIAEIDGLLARFDRFSPEYHALRPLSSVPATRWRLMPRAVSSCRTG